MQTHKSRSSILALCLALLFELGLPKLCSDLVRYLILTSFGACEKNPTWGLSSTLCLFSNGIVGYYVTK